MMGNRRLYKIERFHAPGASESEPLKVTALNLFHPTASPLFPKNRFFHIATQSPVGRGIGSGGKMLEEYSQIPQTGALHG